MRKSRQPSRKPQRLREGAEVPRSFAPVVTALSGERGVTQEKGWGEGNMQLMVHGQIFAMVVKDRLVAKLPGERVDELVRNGTGIRFDPRRDGKGMKEWISIAPRKANWVELAKEAFRFVSGAKD